MAEELNSLPESLFEQLRKERFVLLGTIDAETSTPQMNAISWVYSVAPNRIRFAVDKRSRIISNVTAHPSVNLSFFADGSFHTVNGTASVVVDVLEGVSLRLTCIEVEVATVRDAMFFGARITVEPEYEKTYDKRAAARLDGQVYEAMQKGLSRKPVKTDWTPRFC
ncbi:pyridoxamine 5'-phosphate oxidase family protein [Paenibacillus sp. J2TS4]|uniref:pyridoxamine 5'-phosphate oxidase family protein n=1 Tax=Paenibacillus sp. J2TS4 TaxID=2807194 RepID=UPI001B196E61|nr:pyridoxamine 5'-phosphate oxidase family protein [Paenibacillus sp. J2TS4]GIP36673.1 hypothetical protein J2TS4_58830 [Paenibacillus sp. J2TS4]